MVHSSKLFSENNSDKIFGFQHFWNPEFNSHTFILAF